MRSRCYRRAAEIEPRLPDPFVAIGDTLSMLGAVNEAIIAYNSALARDGAACPALQGLAKAYIETGRPELALAPLNQALALQPETIPSCWCCWVWSTDVEGRHQQAQAYYQQGLQRAPGDPRADRRSGIVAGAERQLPECGCSPAAGRDGAFGHRAGTADLGADLRSGRQHRRSGTARTHRSRRSRGRAQPCLLPVHCANCRRKRATGRSGRPGSGTPRGRARLEPAALPPEASVSAWRTYP